MAESVGDEFVERNRSGLAIDDEDQNVGFVQSHADLILDVVRQVV